jgi:hypothetical protein
VKSLLGPRVSGYVIESPKLRIWSKLRYLSATRDCDYGDGQRSEDPEG